jgi:hypothetical protein
MKIIIILLLLLLLCATIYYKIRNETKINNNNDVRINILTRSGNRRRCFEKLRKSIEKQKYKNWKHIISNDNICNDFLLKYDNVVNVDKIEKLDKKHCPYNLYLNELLEHCDEGWVIVLDDDALLIDDDFLGKLAYQCKKMKKNNIVTYDSYYGKLKILTPAILGPIDMINFSFHTSCPIRFKDKCGGDQRFINDCKKNGYILKWTPILGTWANVNNQAHGKKVICE